MRLYKFTHIYLLKNDGQLKQKSVKQPKKKKQLLNLLKNKNHVPKKSCLVKKKKKKRNNYHTHRPRNQKIKMSEKERSLTNCPCASANGHFRPLSSSFFSLQFSFRLGRKHFGRPKEKTLKPHHLFFFLLF